MDDKRYNSPELVELVKQRLEWFPDYVKEVTFCTYDIIRNVPSPKDVTDIKEFNIIRIGKDLIFHWENSYRQD